MTTTPKRETSQAKRLSQLEEDVATLAWLHAELQYRLLTTILRQALNDPKVQEMMVQRAMQGL